MGKYADAFESSISDREAFWLDAARAVDWVTPPAKALDDSAAPLYRWYPGGELNTSVNALDRHVDAGNGDRAALIWDSAMVGEVRTYSYTRLLDEVSRFAGVLAAQGVTKGDRVIVYMPMIPEAAIAMLACARIGAVHSVVFGGFAAPELATRIDDAQPVALITASGGIEPGRNIEYLPMVAKALELSEFPPTTVIVKDREQVAGSAADYDGWLDWDVETTDAAPADAVTVAATDPLYVLYTSGTTGKPKGIRRPLPTGDVGEVANGAAVFGRAFDFRPFEGPMLVSTGMFHGGSLAYYLGGLNVGHALVIVDRFDAEDTLRLIEEHRIRSGYMVPTQFHRLLQLPEEVRRRYDVSSLHSIVHSAAPCPRPVKEQMMAWWGPVVWETYGGMEGAATIAKPKAWLERPGTVGRAVRGVHLAILDDDGNELGPGEVGGIYLDNGVGFRYHDDPEQTESVYRGDRFFSLGDVGYLDPDGYLFIADRAKDMIITGGTNVYPAEIEGVLLDHPAVHDVAVIGVPDEDWGETIAAVVQPAPGCTPDEALEAELVAHCRERLGSYKVPRRWVFEDDLARTEAGKLGKKKLRDDLIAAGRL